MRKLFSKYCQREALASGWRTFTAVALAVIGINAPMILEFIEHGAFDRQSVIYLLRGIGAATLAALIRYLFSLGEFSRVNRRRRREAIKRIERRSKSNE